MIAHQFGKERLAIVVILRMAEGTVDREDTR